jgi:hypothetical protein
MHKILRQMILGFGTFGTGTALLYLEVNPYLLILTDTVVGVGMLFAAGSLTVRDLHLTRKGVPGEIPVAGAGSLAAETAGESHGLRASLGRIRGSLTPSFGVIGKGKEEKEAEKKKIDLMLDSALVGQSRRIISLAEGQRVPPAAGAAGAETPVQTQDLLQDFSASDISMQLLEDASAEEDLSAPGETPVKPGVKITDEVKTGPLSQQEEEEGVEPQVDALSLADEGLGADDLFSALKFEALREKKKDDSSLLRDLKGVKVTGKQLLEELDSLVRDIRGR